MQQAAKKSVSVEKCTFRELAAAWDISAVYSRIAQELESQQGLLGEVCRYLLLSPGKGLRPLLVLICSTFGHMEKEKRVRLAAGMEILHMAMLVHDDVLDVSGLRRGLPSINSRWDNNTALLTGDFLFGKSLEMVCEFGTEIVGRFSGIIMQSTAGEFQQTEEGFDTSLEIAAYEERIRKKTAVMLANCCAAAAVAAGASPSTVAQLEAFGTNLGMAFQIRDDVADWSSEGKKLGKPVIHDLSQGILTLPLLLALEVSDQKEAIKEMVSTRSLSEQQLVLISQEIRKTGSLELALDRASGYIEQAKITLKALPQNTARQDLGNLVKNMA